MPRFSSISWILVLVFLAGLITYTYAQTKAQATPYDSTIGTNCTIDTRRKCGESLACVDNQCNFCRVDADCYSSSKVCRKQDLVNYNLCKHKDLFPDFNLRDGLTTLFTFLGGVISASGGIGGGGIYVPLFSTIGDFEHQMAIPLSKAMIFGAAVSNFLILARKKHPRSNRPIIDFDAALILEPTTLAGTVIGVIFNVIFPEWIIVILIIIFLTLTTIRTFQIGWEQHEKEKRLKAISGESYQPLTNNQDTVDNSAGIPHDQDEGVNASTSADKPAPAPTPVVQDPRERDRTLDRDLHPEVRQMLKEESRVPWMKVGILFVCWIIILIFSLMKGGHGAPSLIGLECGTFFYWFVSLVSVPILVAICGVVGVMFRRAYEYKKSLNYPFIEGDIHWTMSNTIMFPFNCVTAGVLAGLLGIGGGMVKGPILLEMGLLTEVAAATSNFMILFTSSSTTTQFIFLGMLPWDYGLWFSTLGFLSSFVGQFGIRYFINKYNKQSLIIFSLGFVIAASTLLMGGIGTYHVIRDIQEGAFMGFHNPCR